MIYLCLLLHTHTNTMNLTYLYYCGWVVGVHHAPMCGCGCGRGRGCGCGDGCTVCARVFVSAFVCCQALKMQHRDKKGRKSKMRAKGRVDDPSNWRSMM